MPGEDVGPPIVDVVEMPGLDALATSEVVVIVTSVLGLVLNIAEIDVVAEIELELVAVSTNSGSRPRGTAPSGS